MRALALGRSPVAPLCDIGAHHLAVRTMVRQVNIQLATRAEDLFRPALCTQNKGCADCHEESHAPHMEFLLKPARLHQHSQSDLPIRHPNPRKSPHLSYCEQFQESRRASLDHRQSGYMGPRRRKYLHVRRTRPRCTGNTMLLHKLTEPLFFSQFVNRLDSAHSSLLQVYFIHRYPMNPVFIADGIRTAEFPY